MDDKQKKDFSERLDEKHIVSYHDGFEGPEDFEQLITNCTFHGLNFEDSALFSLTSIPGQNGFHVRMNGVKVMPSKYKTFSYMPKWVRKLCVILGAKEVK